MDDCSVPPTTPKLSDFRLHATSGQFFLVSVTDLQPTETRRAFLESPETFRVGCGHDKSHCILKTKTFSSMKLWYYFEVSHRKDMLKQQLCRMGGSDFANDLSGTKRFWGCRETRTRSQRA